MSGSPQVHTVVITQAAPTSIVWQPNLRATPFQVGFAVYVAASAVGTVQHTYDDIYTMTDPYTQATWFNSPTATSVSAAADGSYTVPVTGFRVVPNFSQSASGGTVTFTWVQAGLT
jgi:hypothetical protein